MNLEIYYLFGNWRCIKGRDRRLRGVEFCLVTDKKYFSQPFQCFNQNYVKPILHYPHCLQKLLQIEKSTE